MLDSQAYIILHQVLEHEESGAFCLVFRKDAYEKGLRGVVALRGQGGKKIHPAEGKDSALGLADRGRNVGHCDREAHKFVFVIDHKRHKVLVENRDILAYITVYLLLGELGVFIEPGKGLVEHMEHLAAALCHFPDGAGGIDANAEAL